MGIQYMFLMSIIIIALTIVISTLVTSIPKRGLSKKDVEYLDKLMSRYFDKKSDN